MAKSVSCKHPTSVSRRAPRDVRDMKCLLGSRDPRLKRRIGRMLVTKKRNKKIIFQERVSSLKQQNASLSHVKKTSKTLIKAQGIKPQFKKTKREPTRRMKSNRRDKGRYERESVKRKPKTKRAYSNTLRSRSSARSNFDMSLRPKDEDDLAENLLQRDRKLTRTFVRGFHKAWMKKYHPDEKKRDWLIDHVNKTLLNQRQKSSTREKLDEIVQLKSSKVSLKKKNGLIKKPKRVYRSKKSIKDNLQSHKVALLMKIPLEVYKNPASFIGDSGCLGFNLVESDKEDYRKPVKRPFNRKKTEKLLKKQVQISESDSDECSSEREFKAMNPHMSKKDSMMKVSSIQFQREFQDYLRKVRGEEAYDFPNLGKLTLIEPDDEQLKQLDQSASVSVLAKHREPVPVSLDRQRQALNALKAAKQSQRAMRAKIRVEKSDHEAPEDSYLDKKKGKKQINSKKPTKKKVNLLPKFVAEAVEPIKKPRGRPRKVIEVKMPSENPLEKKHRVEKRDEIKLKKKDKLEKIRQSVSKHQYVEDTIEKCKVQAKKNEGELLGKRQSVSPIPDPHQDTSRKVLVDAIKTTAASNKKLERASHLANSPGFHHTLKKEGAENQRFFLEDLQQAQALQTRKKSLDDKINFEESAYKLQQVTIKKAEEGGLNIKESLNKIFDRLGNEKASLEKGKISIREKENTPFDIKKKGYLTEKTQNVIQDVIKRSLIKSIKKSESKEATQGLEKLNSILKLPEASTRYEELLKPQGHLSLPHSYKNLLQKFEKLDDVVNFMNMKQTPTYLGVVTKAFTSSFNE